MARAPRVEYDGAQYHVMCRRNRREPIFEDEEDHGIFLTALGQGCERSGWLIHAYVLMKNHYHFLLETPGGNLVGGRQWFQTTCTARFNARHRVSGHLLQGRYKALLIDPGDSVYARRVADYIHLNPVRAGVVRDEKALADLRWCSYRPYVLPTEKPAWLEVETVYGDLGLSSSKAAERRRYRRTMGGLIGLEVRDGGGEEGSERRARRSWVRAGLLAGRTSWSECRRRWVRLSGRAGGSHSTVPKWSDTMPRRPGRSPGAPWQRSIWIWRGFGS
jgi:putative transposase